MSKLSDKEKNKLAKYASHYRTSEKLIIASTARKTVKYIEKTAINFPNEYYVLKNKIISCAYAILENIYRANIFQDVKDKKEVIVNIQLLNFYLEELLNKGLINNKKLVSLTNHLIEIDKMTRGWLNCEKGS